MTEITNERKIACGIDVHKKLLVVTIVCPTSDEYPITKEFPNDIHGIDAIREWVVKESCDVVAFESTGIYWRFLYLGLEGLVPIEVANAYQIKGVPGKKTDARDSEWIATLALNRQISPSRVFTGNQEEFRAFLRYRRTLVEERTSTKNRIHKILDTENIHLARILKDIFGKSGLVILEGFIQGKSIDEIIDHLPPRIRVRKEEIIQVLASSMSQANLVLLKSLVHTLTSQNNEIKEMEIQIAKCAQELRKEEWNLLCTIPGVGALSSATLLAEIGDIHQFPTPSKLVAWAGLNPSVYQSAGVNYTGHITKQGNPYLRWILVECATACSKKKGTQLYQFFERLRTKIGYKKAIVALARKLLILVWHLLINMEPYDDPGYRAKKEVSIPGFLKLVKKIGSEEAIEIINIARTIDRNLNIKESDLGGL